MTWLNSILVIGHTKRILYGDIIKVFGLLSEYIGCLFLLCAICYFHVKSTILLNTKAHFKNYVRSMGQVG